MRKLLAAVALVATALFAGPSLATAAEPTGPAIEIRLRSVNDLLDHAEYLADLAGQAENAKQGVGFIRAISNAKTGIEGVDPTRPIAGYAIVTADVINSPVVLVLPIADEELFRGLLKSKLSLDVKDPVDGVYEVKVPNFPQKVFFRFANKSAYITVRDAKNLDPKTLVAPETLFAEKDDALASVRLHMDRIPADVRKTVFGEIEMAAGQLKTRKLDGETPAIGKLKPVLLDAAIDAIHAIFHEGQSLTFRLVVDPKSDELTAELSFAGKPGSNLAKTLQNVGNKPGVAGKLPAGSNPLAAFGLRLALTENLRDKLKPGIDALMDELLEKADPNGKEFAKMILEAVAPTLLAGELDFGIAATGPDDKGTYGLAAGLKMKDGKALEKLLIKFAPFVPEDQAKLDLLEDKINGVNLHRITLMDEEQTKKLGTDTVWIGFSESLLLVTLEKKDGKIIKGIVGGDARKVPLVGGEVAISRLLPLIEKSVPPEKLQKLVANTVGKETAGKDTWKLTLDGGEALTLRLTAKGKTAKLLVGLDRVKKE